ncbi:MAG: AAA family ATPase, partial [Candidatus Parcubacteria bacterium]|nr:AAA family ATPase [Candidatus Parcubacteria bacterium]
NMTNSKIILGFVGPIASGKGTACSYLKDKHNAQIFRFSSMLRDVLDRFYIPQSRENMQAASLALRRVFGDDLMAKTIANDVKNSTAEIIALDGVRRIPDIKYLQEVSGFHLVEINGEQKIRFERILKRSENTDDNKKTLSEFQNDELQEAELQIKDVSQIAEFHIDNNGTITDLQSQIENILQKLS